MLTMLWRRFVVRLGRCYLHYLVQMAVYEDTDSANKRNHDVINHDGNMLRHNCALLTLFFPSVMIALA